MGAQGWGRRGTPSHVLCGVVTAHDTYGHARAPSLEFIPIKLSVARVCGASGHDGGRRSTPRCWQHGLKGENEARQLIHSHTGESQECRRAGRHASTRSTSQRGGLLASEASWTINRDKLNYPSDAPVPGDRGDPIGRCRSARRGCGTDMRKQTMGSGVEGWVAPPAEPRPAGDRQ